MASVALSNPPRASLEALCIAEQRRESGYEVGQSDDGHFLVASLNGGGYAGVDQLGMLKALDDRELMPMFDVLVADSVAALNGLAVTAGQLDHTLAVYEKLPDDNFVDGRRPLLQQGPIMELDRLHARLTHGTPSLDTQAALSSPTEVRFSIARADTLEHLTKSTKDPDVTPENLVWWVMRGAQVPGIAGPLKRAPTGSYVHTGDGDFKQLSDEPYLCDGGLACKPTAFAAIEIAQQMTAETGQKINILNFANGPTPEKWTVNPLLVNLVALCLRKYGRPDINVMQQYRDIVRGQTRLEHRLHSGQVATEAGVSVEFLHADPPKEEGLPKLPSFLTQDRRRLRFGYLVGRNSVLRALGEEPTPVLENLPPAGESVRDIAAAHLKAASKRSALLLGNAIEFGRAYALGKP